MKTAYAEDKGL